MMCAALNDKRCATFVKHWTYSVARGAKLSPSPPTWSLIWALPPTHTLTDDFAGQELVDGGESNPMQWYVYW